MGNLTKEEAIDLVKRRMEYCAEKGRKKERTSRFKERIGADALKEAVL